MVGGVECGGVRRGCRSFFPSNVPYQASCALQEQAAAQSLTAAQTAAQLAGTNPKLLQQLSSELQIQPSDTNAISDDADTVRHMSALAEQLPWQLRQQSTEQLLPDSTDEQGGAEDTATSIQAEPQLITDFSRAARALEVGSFAEQQQQQLQQQVPGFVSMTDATRSSRAMDDVGMSQDGRGEEEAAAKAAYRQWSESFEARVWGHYSIDLCLSYTCLKCTVSTRTVSNMHHLKCIT